ncbi:MAG: FapA family protein [Desulfuromonadaceae bacterium]|nr:FapA family protein [Desulfuromonadaceae bacterium]
MTDQRELVPSAAPTPGGNEIKKLGYSLYLKIPDNYLECRCSYVPHEQGSMITRDELAAFLKQYNVREGIDQSVFDDFVLKAAAGRQQIDVLLASGTAPVAGADEYILLSVQPSAAVRSGDEVVTNIDMHIVQAFINVSSGDEIGRIIPAEPGIPGRNIMGMPIPAQPGKPLHMTVGKNIRVEENGAALTAAATGRLCQSSGEISVEEEYVVKGDVNFRVGSINFKGVVEVRGDVLDNFDITASKGLTVTGNIGACSIVSDGDVTFCGMDGQEKGHIVSGGTLRAHFIHDAVVECVGDVIVDVEIHNCTIRTLGRVVVDKGAISGGSCVARGGIEAKKLGSAASVHTKLHAGVDFHDVELLENLFSALTEAQNNIKKSQSQAETEELRSKSATLTDDIMTIRGKIDALANAKINAKSLIYENVQLTVGGATEELNEEKDGPISVIENSIDGGLRFLSMTSLDVKATDIELAFVREQRKVS